MPIYIERDEDDDVVIWSNPEPGDRFSGLCIGVGPTLEAAKADARQFLTADLAALEALTTEV